MRVQSVHFCRNLPVFYVEYCHCRQTDDLAKQTSSEIIGVPISVNIIYFYMFIIYICISFWSCSTVCVTSLT